jgi:hypothetical protein
MATLLITLQGKGGVQSGGEPQAFAPPRAKPVKPWFLIS